MTGEPEDYRVKNAREGKAFFSPGRSVEERNAITAKERAEASEVQIRTIALTAQQWSLIDTAIPDLIKLLDDVYHVFFHLAYEDDLDWPWVNSSMRLAARGIQSFQAKEIAVLDKLDFAIRHALDKER